MNGKTNRVTLRDIYHLNEKIDEKLDRLGERVSILEMWRANLMGKVTAIIAVVSLVFTMIWEWFKSKNA